jgi:hypothetical protein
MTHGIDDQGTMVLCSAGVQYVIISFSKASKPAVGSTQPSIQGKSETFCSAIRQPVHEVDQSPPSRDEFKNVWRYTSIHLGYDLAWCIFTSCNNVVVLVTSSKLLLRLKSRGGLGE